MERSEQIVVARCGNGTMVEHLSHHAHIAARGRTNKQLVSTNALAGCSRRAPRGRDGGRRRRIGTEHRCERRHGLRQRL
eukprot:scaffold274920_cov30-Tisochrysis_lutea.AAC.2